MWELDCEEGWAPKNWCFWTVVLDTAFLPKSKHLLISWLQSLSAVILKPKKIKSVTVSIFFPLLHVSDKYQNLCPQRPGSIHQAPCGAFWLPSTSTCFLRECEKRREWEKHLALLILFIGLYYHTLHQSYSQPSCNTAGKWWGWDLNPTMWL